MGCGRGWGCSYLPPARTIRPRRTSIVITYPSLPSAGHQKQSTAIDRQHCSLATYIQKHEYWERPSAGCKWARAHTKKDWCGALRCCAVPPRTPPHPAPPLRLRLLPHTPVRPATGDRRRGGTSAAFELGTCPPHRPALPRPANAPRVHSSLPGSLARIKH